VNARFAAASVSDGFDSVATMNEEAHTMDAAEQIEGRIDALKAEVGSLDREDVQRVSLPLPDEARRATLRRAVDEAHKAGRAEILAETRREMQREAFVRYDRALLRPTWMGLLNWGLSSGTAADRASVAFALDEAAVLAVAEDLVGEQDREVLSWAPDTLFSAAAHAADPGSLAHALPSGVPRTGVAAAAVVSLVAIGVGTLTAPIVAMVAMLRGRRRRS
jgi:hypothetical protein